MEERIVKKLMTSVKCTGCGQKYEMRDVKILGNHQDLYFLQVTCSSCHSRYLITAVINDKKNPDIVSDLTDEEFTKFKNFCTLSTNDVLDMHTYLKAFDGDFSGLFGYKKCK
jgi:DNA-directed RNA polymerase subunit RPC12/RpoP